MESLKTTMAINYDKLKQSELHTAKNIIWPVAGGKGGIGKSTIAANLGITLAKKLTKRSKKVMLIDADLGCGSLSWFLGIDNPHSTLKDFILKKRASLTEFAIDTSLETLKLIVGSNGFLGISNLKYFQKTKIIDQIRKLDFDYIIVDLGAGSSYNVIDLFLISNEGIIVTVPDRISVYTTYGFLKTCLLRKILRTLYQSGHTQKSVHDLIHSAWVSKSHDAFVMKNMIKEIEHLDAVAAYIIEDITFTFKPRLIVNMVGDSDDKQFGEQFKTFVHRSLNIELDYIGSVGYDDDVRLATKMMKPVVLQFPEGPFAECLDLVVWNLMGYNKNRMKFFKNFQWE